MRIKTDGKHEYRLDLIRRVMQQSGEGTKSGALDFALEHTLTSLRTIEEAADHPDMTPELAEVLSTDQVEIEYYGYDVDVKPSRKARAEADSG